MNDIVDSQGREAMLSDHSGSVACSNVNMTSIDSGVETGNDSNDGPTVQQEGQQHQSASQIIDGMMADVESDGVVKNMYNLSTLFSCSSYNPMFIPETPADACLNSKNEMFQIIRNRYMVCDLFPSNICDCYDMIKECVRRKCVWTQTKRAQRRMRFAAITNNVTLMKRLLKFGVSPNNHDEHGRTPLHISAGRGYTEIARLLLENGADPKQRDYIGNTPLHLAAAGSLPDLENLENLEKSWKLKLLRKNREKSWKNTKEPGILPREPEPERRSPACEPTTLRRSQRTRRPPDRLNL